MTERLRQKLQRNRSGDGGRDGRRPACVTVHEQWGVACEFVDRQGGVCVLPYASFERAEIASDHASLTVVFTTHEVRLEGAHLQNVKDAIARSRNVMVRAADPAWKKHYAESEAFVSAMEITARKPGAKTPDRAGTEAASA